MSFRGGICLPRLPNLHFYSETVKSRHPFSKQDRDLILSKRRVDEIPTKRIKQTDNHSEFSNEEPSFNPEPSNRVPIDSQSRKKGKKYYQILNEIEEKALKDYDKLKETRSKSLCKGAAVLKREKLRDIKEVPNQEELEEISCLMESPRELLLEESFQGWELEKVNQYLRERIEGELSQPIMSRPLGRINGKKELKQGEIRLLREKQRMGKEIEAILGRERLFYVKQLENFLKKRELPV